MRFLADMVSQVRNEEEKIREGGGAKAIENQHNKKRLTARERIKLLDGGPRFNRYKLDVRGYKGVFGQAILAGQFLYHIADGRLPDYQRPFLGGSATLRGENPGAFIGDNLVLTSLELRMPLNSKLAVYRAGIDVFFDSGAVYDHGRSLGSADFKHGAGIGFFLFVAGYGIKVDFAHNLRDNFRVHFSTSFRF